MMVAAARQWLQLEIVHEQYAAFCREKNPDCDVSAIPRSGMPSPSRPEIEISRLEKVAVLHALFEFSCDTMPGRQPEPVFFSEHGPLVLVIVHSDQPLHFDITRL